MKKIVYILPNANKLSIIIDTNEYPLYGNALRNSLIKSGYKIDTFIIPAGESSKNLKILEKIYDSFIDFGITRIDAIIALLGSAVGFLLDFSVGGKTAINLLKGKNCVGAF